VGILICVEGRINMTKKEISCYDCKNESLCRLKDKAKDFLNYVNNTGSLIKSDILRETLYNTMAVNCSEYSEYTKEK
jgi:hypothetical protein